MSVKKLIDTMIEDEYHKIQESKENEDMKNNKEYQEQFDESIKLFKNILENLPEDHRNILYEYEDTVMAVHSELMRYYFRQGIKAAFNELECLKEYSEVL